MKSRRDFLKTAAVTGFPMIVPSSVFGQSAPSNTVQIGQIGCGRIARTHDIKETIRHTGVGRFVAVCDLDKVRLADGKQLIEEYYAKNLGAGKAASVKTYSDYRELLKDPGIDAVIISTPDHWHAQPAMEAALAGKDVYLQKPASLTINEGRQMADAVKKSGRIFQQGSQQRSEFQFRYACELVRNGSLGKIQEILVGLPTDPPGGSEKKMATPSNLNYEMWLGSTPDVYYTEDRVHPQTDDPKKRYDRPGWLRCEQFGAGMITGWGAHHIDIAHWAMGLEHSGPVEIEALAEFPTKGLWDVHGAYNVRAKYANGAAMHISDKFPVGVKFIGERGWIWVTRGTYQPGDWKAGNRRAVLDASDVRILEAGVPDNGIKLHVSPQNDHHLDWLESVRSRKAPAAPVEDGHRSCSACLLAYAAMKLKRPLKWNPEIERFVNDPGADALLARTQRAPYGTTHVKTA